jgi:hypothetical protein
VGAYTEFATVLIAPHAFRNRFEKDCAKFDHFVPHEEIAEYLPEFAVTFSTPARFDK